MQSVVYLVICLNLSLLAMLKMRQTKHDPVVCIIMRNKY